MKKQDFIKLQKEWYKKLDNDGQFKDIEYFDKRTMEPRDMMYKESQKAQLLKDKFTSTEQYYIEARRLSHHYNFNTKMDKKIWTLHSDGEPYRTIASHLGQPYQKVFKTVNKYRDLMLDPAYRNQDGNTEDEENVLPMYPAQER